MSFPLFRFTLSNTTEGTLEIKEPEGWDDGTLKLERNKEYHSLVEFWDQPLLFDDAEASDMVTGAILPGGLEWIKNIEYTQGVGAIINIEIEISEDDGDTYERIFYGLLALDTVKEVDFYKAEYGINRDDFWAKFISQKSKSVDLSSIVDLQGNARTPILPFTLPLPSQKVRQQYHGEASLERTVAYSTVPNNDYAQIDFEQEILSEIETKFNYPLAENSQRPSELFAVKYGGDYAFDIKIISTTNLLLGNSTDPNLDVIVQINDGAGITLTKANVGTNGIDGRTEHTYTGTQTLVTGDFIRLYFLNNTGGSYSWELPPSLFYDTHLIIIADTIYDDTETEAFLLKDALESAISRTVGFDDVLQSDYFDGCGEPIAVILGVHARGYTMTEKPFTTTVDDLWGGINPMANLGLGYIDGENKIEIEKKEEFYNKTPVLNLDFVNMIERSYDLDRVVKSVQIGYEKSLSESFSGIDDPQTKRNYNTSYPTVGKDEKILSKFVAASMSIEQTRRNRKEANKDWKLDDDILVIALTLASPWTPEFSENFSLITNLLNSDFRYNIRWSAARNFERWQNYFNGGLLVPSGQDIKFGSGEGNYDMTSQLNPDDCEASDDTPEPVIDEKGNFAVTDDFLYTPIMYNFEHPLTFEDYKLIRDNRKHAIGVSRSDSDHKPCFIMNCEYKPTRKIAVFEVLLGVNEPIGYEPSAQVSIAVTAGLGEATFTGFLPTVTVGLP